jgi:hypothetical protein
VANRLKRAAAVLAVGGIFGCAPAAGVPGAQTEPPAPQRADSSDASLIPAGFGTLRQEDVSIQIQSGGLLVRAIPLDESLLRVLAPDTYRILRDVREGHATRIAEVAGQYGMRAPSVWYFIFFALERDVRFSPQDVVISSIGRDFRPIQLIPITTGFGQNRLDQGDRHSALYLFDESLDLDQPLTLTVESVRSSAWEQTLRAIERERAMVRSRAGRAPPPPARTTGR